MSRTATVAVRISLVLALSLAAVSASVAAPGERIVARTEMVAAKEVFNRSEELSMRFTLENASDHAVRVLVRRTPLAGFAGDVLEVRRGGEEVAYIGRLVKWGPPRPEDFVEIEAGGSVSAVVDPSAAYDMSRPGNYTIRYRAEALELADKTGVRPVPREVRAEAASPIVEAVETSLQLEGVDAGPAVESELEAMSQPPVYTACTSSRQSSLQTALNNAEQMSIESRGYLQTLPVSERPSNARYKEWFGAYDSGRYSTVTSDYVAIADAFSNKTVSFFCDCTDSSYAYVYPNRPYEIHLCNAFWSAPATGTDSKAGTLVHEMSHFDVVANTNDYAYGQTACRKLANKQPRKAIANADSHEYFAEAGGH